MDDGGIPGWISKALGAQFSFYFPVPCKRGPSSLYLFHGKLFFDFQIGERQGGKDRSTPHSERWPARISAVKTYLDCSSSNPKLSVTTPGLSILEWK